MWRQLAAGGLAALGALLVATAPAGSVAAGGGRDRGSHHWARHVAAARRFAARRAGIVSFAVVDEDKRLRGVHPYRTFDSASVVKVMLMVAYLNAPDVRHRDLHEADRKLLRPMITRSDNATAQRIYDKVGNAGLNAVAHDAGMRRFTPNHVWGLSKITARDQAQFMYRIDHFIPNRHLRYAMRLLKEIIPSQRWGIPPAVPRGWVIHFKGGFVPDGSTGLWKINQVALLRNPPRRLSLAILTRGNPSAGYGHETVRGVAHRLLKHYNRDTRRG
jgi:beta-lactamase class A